MTSIIVPQPGVLSDVYIGINTDIDILIAYYYKRLLQSMGENIKQQTELI